MNKSEFIRRAKENPEKLYMDLYKQLPDTMECDDCGEHFLFGSRCSKHVKNVMTHYTASFVQENYSKNRRYL